MNTLAEILQWLSFLDSPWVHWPIAIALIALIVWRLRWQIQDRSAKLVAWSGNRKNQRIAIIAALTPIGAIWLWLLVEALTEVWTLTSGIPQEGSGKDIADANRNRVQAIFFGVGLIGALLAAIIVPVRLWFQYRQTTTAEQGHITDRLTKAIEQLGAEKTYKRTEWDENKRDKGIEETFPNLEVRLGAIYALERIAQDSERDHITVMETLCAYIRENAPASEAMDHDLGDWPEYPDNATAEELEERQGLLNERFEKLIVWISTLPPPRVDIQAALTVIGRRSDERIEFERRQVRPFRLDLRNTNLQAVDLRFAKFDNALMNNAFLCGSDLSGALMNCAVLRQTIVQKARLTAANLEYSDLSHSLIDGTDLAAARIDGAKFVGARILGASLWKARMRETNLKKARLEGSNLWGALLTEADFEKADLRSTAVNDSFAGTSVRATDLRSDSITQTILNKLFGDDSTKIPDGLIMPDHWDDVARVIFGNDTKFETWLASGAPPGKPRE